MVTPVKVIQTLVLYLNSRLLLLGVSGDTKRNTEIGTIASWGPWFRVSFELMINSLVRGGRWGWSNVLVFKGKGRRNDIPGVWVHRDARYGLLFTNYVNGKRNYYFNNLIKIKLKKWYKIVIEQKSVNGKVRKYFQTAASLLALC